MADIKSLLKRNQAFASNYCNTLGIIPRFSSIILTCLDARTDPAHFLALKAGDALVIRNAGGRVTPDVELEIGLLWEMVKNFQGEKFKGLDLAIIHHTDCGMERIANPEIITGLSQRLGVDKNKIESLAIPDHEQSLKDDIERVRNSSFIPKDLSVTGYLMDIKNGLVNTKLYETIY